MSTIKTSRIVQKKNKRVSVVGKPSVTGCFCFHTYSLKCGTTAGVNQSAQITGRLRSNLNLKESHLLQNRWKKNIVYVLQHCNLFLQLQIQFKRPEPGVQNCLTLACVRVCERDLHIFHTDPLVIGENGPHRHGLDTLLFLREGGGGGGRTKKKDGGNPTTKDFLPCSIMRRAQCAL